MNHQKQTEYINNIRPWKIFIIFLCVPIKEFSYFISKSISELIFVGSIEIFFESSQLIGINNTSTSSMDLNTSCLSDVVSHVDIIGLGGSRTIDGGIGLLSKLGIEFYQKENLIENPLFFVSI